MRFDNKVAAITGGGRWDPGLQHIPSDAQVKEVPPPFNAFHPLGRNDQPRDVSEAILFLASNQASWITGVASCRRRCHRRQS